VKEELSRSNKCLAVDLKDMKRNVEDARKHKTQLTIKLKKAHEDLNRSVEQANNQKK